MNLTETQRILASIQAVYPSFIKDRDIDVLEQVWLQVFANVPYEEVNRALGLFFASDAKGFPPTPGAVNAYIRKAQQLEAPSEHQAWAKLLKAVSRGLYNSTEEYEKLPEDIREIVGHPRVLYEWAQLSTSEMNTVIAPGFLRSWRARQELKRELDGMFMLEEKETNRKLIGG